MIDMKRVSRGFTLIELMIVIAIVAILVALAVPAYNDYTIRSKIAECVNNAAVTKLAVSEFRESEGRWPNYANEAGIGNTTGDTYYCLPTDYDGNGEFTVNLDAAQIDPALASSTEVRMIPNDTNIEAGIDWDCQPGGTSADQLKYLPSQCRTIDT